jgi:hypothetical protein
MADVVPFRYEHEKPRQTWGGPASRDDDAKIK